ncbi:hypothetical protein BT69DRAFT_1346999 [Atractiella rhizophila]|nr:hypothetical protein BT69DRAFT_1346999 [Atractiella rhizophila]
MSSQVPTSTSIYESAALPFALADVWELISNLNFDKWWSIVDKFENNAEGGVLTTFKDGTKTTFKLEEYSQLDHFVTYSAISSDPPLGFSSALSTIRLYPITSDNSTFIQWTATFSGDAGADVIQDAKYKRREGLLDLRKALERKQVNKIKS